MYMAPPGDGAPAKPGGAPDAHPAGQTHTEPAGCHNSRWPASDPAGRGPARQGLPQRHHPSRVTQDAPSRRHHGGPDDAAKRRVGLITPERVTTSAGGSPKVEESANLAIPAQ